MKKQLSLLLMLLVSLSLFAGSKGKIAFEATRYDFGYIEESKGVVAHDFEFTNTGKGALIIIDTRLYRLEIFQGAHRPGQEGNHQRDVRPQGPTGSFPQRDQGLHKRRQVARKTYCRGGCCT